MPSIIIIGSGPAGISAALYAVRAGVDTTVLTKGPGALDRAEKIENYYGFAEPVSGAELERRSIENAKRLGVRFVTACLLYTSRLAQLHGVCNVLHAQLVVVQCIQDLDAGGVAEHPEQVGQLVQHLVVRHIQGFRLRRGHCFLYFRHVDISLRCGFT